MHVLSYPSPCCPAPPSPCCPAPPSSPCCPAPPSSPGVLPLPPPLVSRPSLLPWCPAPPSSSGVPPLPPPLVSYPSLLLSFRCYVKGDSLFSFEEHKSQLKIACNRKGFMEGLWELEEDPFLELTLGKDSKNRPSPGHLVTMATRYQNC